MARILIIDNTPLFTEPLAVALRAAGHETDTASLGDEGLAKARAAVPDLIILDVSLPKIGGLEVAAQCRAESLLKRVPIVMLGAAADRKTVLRAVQLGVRDYLLKTYLTVPEMMRRFQKYVGVAVEKPAAQSASAAQAAAAPQELPQLMTREQCIGRVEHATAARPLSGAVAQVLSMAASPTAEMSDLAALIGRDPVLSTRVLRAANSAAFAGVRKIVTTIPDAVRNIGMSALRNIATALSVYEAVPTGGTDGFHHMRSWQHSFSAAIICQHLAEKSGKADGGAAYLVGLCHDLGQILFRTEFGSEYTEVLKRQAETGRPLDEVERHMLGTTQLDLAKLILKKLSLPDDIRQPIEEFHAFKIRNERPPTLPLASLLHMADLYANGLLMAALPTGEVGSITKSECKAALGRDDPPRPDAEGLRGQILALTPLLARLSEEEERKLSQPLIANSERRVCLIRDAAQSVFDPLEAALHSLGQLKVLPKLPESISPDEFDVVVLSVRHRAALNNAVSVPVLRISSEPLPSHPAEGGITECGATISLERLAAFVSPQQQRQERSAA